MTLASSWNPGTSSLWRERPFVLLAAARAVSVLGNGFAQVALAFAVLALPGAGPGRLSLVLACQAVPQLVLILAGDAPVLAMCGGRTVCCGWAPTAHCSWVRRSRA
ncbi:hypothetical protein [Streptomyces hokutonensis]|uniref:hypothetical protein n=1 Tax=Streptomyces hokutonensis TaxID=1306990 RepID=UPI003683FFA7